MRNSLQGAFGEKSHSLPSPTGNPNQPGPHIESLRDSKRKKRKAFSSKKDLSRAYRNGLDVDFQKSNFGQNSGSKPNQSGEIVTPSSVHTPAAHAAAKKRTVSPFNGVAKLRTECLRRMAHEKDGAERRKVSQLYQILVDPDCIAPGILMALVSTNEDATTMVYETETTVACMLASVETFLMND